MAENKSKQDFSDQGSNDLAALNAWREHLWAEYKDKSACEWRFAYSLWAALLGASGLVIAQQATSETLGISSWYIVIILPLVLLLHIMFLIWIHIRLREIRQTLDNVVEEIQCLVGLRPPVARAKWLGLTSPVLQVVLTILLVFILAMLLSACISKQNYPPEIVEAGMRRIINMVIELVAMLAFIATAIFTLLAARGARESAKATADAAQAQLYTQLMEEYGAKTMSEALSILKKVQGQKVWEEWLKFEQQKDSLQKDLARSNAIKLIRKTSTGDNKAADKVDEVRRHVKYYFLKIYKLDVQGFLPEKLTKELLSVDGIKIFFEVVQRMENLINEHFDNSSFEALRKRAKHLSVKELKGCNFMK